jgi:Domain of unknown function (DUF4476)
MKRLCTFLALVTATLSASAYYGETKLTVSSSSNATVRVMVDGNKYSSSGSDGLVIRDLPAGYHTVKVFQKKASRGNGGFGKSAYQVVYTGQVFLKAQYHTDITVNRFGKVLVDEQQMGFGYNEDEDDDWGDNNGGGWNNGGGNGQGGYEQAMNARVFEQFKQTLRNESFDNTRLSLAKQTIGTNFFTSLQVKEIVSLFSFETNKLEIAKYAYAFTVDKGSYFVVNDAFTYGNSKEELSNFIRNKR